MRRKLLVVCTALVILQGAVADETAFAASSPDGEAVYADISDKLYQCGGRPDEVVETSEESIDGASYDRAAVMEALYKGMYARNKSINISSYRVPLTDIAKLVQDTANSYPELYAFAGQYSYSPSFDPRSGSYVRTVSPVYDTETAYDDDAFKAAAKKALKAAKDCESDMERAIALHDYLAVNCEYAEDYVENSTGTVYYYHNAYSALVDGISVCQGYALAYEYLLGKLGIEAYMVTNTGHAWNKIKLGDEYYHVDVTWDDQVTGSVNSRGGSGRYGTVYHNYMFLTDDTITAVRSHGDWSSLAEGPADDDTYEDAFWRENKVATPLVISGNYIYYGQPYVRGGTVYPQYTDSIDRVLRESFLTSDGELVVDIAGQVTPSPGYGDARRFSGLFETGGRIYFNTPHAVYSFETESGEYRKEYENDERTLYACFLRDGCVYCVDSDDEYFEIETLYELPEILPDEDEDESGEIEPGEVNPGDDDSEQSETDDDDTGDDSGQSESGDDDTGDDSGQSEADDEKPGDDDTGKDNTGKDNTGDDKTGEDTGKDNTGEREPEATDTQSGENLSTGQNGSGSESAGQTVSDDRVPPSQGAQYAAENDNLAPVATSGSIASMGLTFLHVGEAKADPEKLHMTVIKGTKLRTLESMKSVISDDQGAIKVRLKDGIALITAKKDGSVRFEAADGSRYRVSFKVEKPKPQKSAKTVSIKQGDTVSMNTLALFGTTVSAGKLSVTYEKAMGQATVRDNVLYLKRDTADVVKLRYQYLNKKYRISVRVK